MNFYVTGGSLQYDAPSYVERQADRDLFRSLLEGEFCYVLTARQMGKSSLMVRTANRLRGAGVKVAALDLTAIGGQNVSPDQWYHGLLDLLGQALDLEDELEIFWEANLQLGPLHRLMKAVRQIVLGQLEAESSRNAEPVDTAQSKSSSVQSPNPRVRLVIFVDEIDFVRSLPFATDEFFAAIRQCYNNRTLDPVYHRLTFCLLGVASPSDLIRDAQTTPFNIGRRIELNDFTKEEAGSLAKGLEVQSSEAAGCEGNAASGSTLLSSLIAQQLLDRILYWTEGHPYLTQRLCRMTSETLRGDETALKESQLAPSRFIDRACAEMFFSHRARERDDNLTFVRERLLRDDGDRAGLLDLYLKIWRSKRVMDDELDPLITVLRLSGVVRVENGRLRERNRIYGRVFDSDWVRANMPEAELRRQREAYRRGVIWAASVSSVIIFALGLLSVLAAKKTFEANVAQAQAWRSSGRMGQRTKALDAIEKANHWGSLFGARSKLRDEAIAALNLVDLREVAPLEARVGEVTAPELSPTFRRYAVADRDGRIRVVTREHDKLELTLPATGSHVRWLRFAPVEDYLAVAYSNDAGSEQRFILWHLPQKSPVVDLREDIARDAWDVDANADRLAIGLNLSEIRTYSLPSGELLPGTVPAIEQPGKRRVSCVRFGPAGTQLAASSQSCLDVYVFDLPKKTSVAYPHPNVVVDLDWNPNGKQLVTACRHGDIFLLDATSGAKERLFASPAQFVAPSVCFNRIGSVLAARCSDLSLRLWRPQNRRPILTSFDVNEPDGPARLRFSSDDRWLSLGSHGRQTHLLQVEGGRELITFQGEPLPSETFQSISFDPQGRVLIAAGSGPRIWLWDARYPRPIQPMNLAGLIATAGFACNGDCLFASTTAGFFRFPVSSSRNSLSEELAFGPPHRMTLRVGLGQFALATNQTVAVIKPQKTADEIRVFSLDKPDQDSSWLADQKLTAIAITPEGRWLFACAGVEREILVWDLSGAKGRTPCERFPGSTYLGLSPSGKWLVTAWDGNFQFRKVGSWAVSQRLNIRCSQKFERFTPVAFGALSEPGYCLLAAATSPTSVELFRFFDGDSPTLERLVQLESPDRLPIARLVLDPTGSRLAAGSEANIIQVWDLAELREELRERGLAGTFPELRALPREDLAFTFKSLNQTEEGAIAARLEEEWLTLVENLTDQIETTPPTEPQKLFSSFVRRGRALRALNRRDLALRDFERALELQAEDETVLRLKTAVERELAWIEPRTNSSGTTGRPQHP